jgi:hypothetical protein
MRLDAYLQKEGLTQVKFAKVNNINLSKLVRTRRGDAQIKEVLEAVKVATNGLVTTFSELVTYNGKRWCFQVPVSHLEEMAAQFPEAQGALARFNEMGGGKQVVVTITFEDSQTA